MENYAPTDPGRDFLRNGLGVVLPKHSKNTFLGFHRTPPAQHLSRESCDVRWHKKKQNTTVPQQKVLILPPSQPKPKGPSINKHARGHITECKW